MTLELLELDKVIQPTYAWLTMERKKAPKLFRRWGPCRLVDKAGNVIYVIREGGYERVFKQPRRKACSKESEVRKVARR